MRRIQMLTCAALVAIGFVTSMIWGVSWWGDLPAGLTVGLGAAFCFHHVRTYKESRRFVAPWALFGAETSYALAYLIVFFHKTGLVPDDVRAIVPVIHYTGLACMATAAIALLAFRRPLHYQEGALDFVVAVAAASTLEWQLHGQNGQAVVSVLTTFVIPIFCVIILSTVLSVFYRMFIDDRLSKLTTSTLGMGGVLATIGNVGYAYYKESVVIGSFREASWPNAFTVTGGLLISCALLYRNSPRIFLPEEGFGQRLSVMRYVGPIAALFTNPAMIALLLVKHETPSLPLAISSAALTAVVILRIRRLLNDREQARLQSELGEKRFQSLVEYAADVIAVTTSDGKITYVSPGILPLVGVTVEEAKGQMVHSFIAAEYLEDLTRSKRSGKGFVNAEVELNTKSGGHRWATIKGIDHTNDPSVQGWVWNVHDITDRKQSEQMMKQLALYDQLTGLPNRTQMRERLGEYLNDPAPIGPLAVLFCDLDGFKAVNDLMGHEVGDEVLRTVASRWSAELRAHDILGRWGGDEFVVICPLVDDLEPATRVADRLLASLSMPLTLTSGEAKIGASIGVVVAQGGETMDSLLQRADAAMYVAKRRAINLYVG